MSRSITPQIRSKINKEELLSKMVRNVAIFASLVVAAHLMLAIYLASHDLWAYLRLAGPIAWFRGVPLYDTLSGPKTGWVYLPLPAIFMGLSAWCASPSRAVRLCTLLSLLVSCGPLLFYLFRRYGKQNFWRILGCFFLVIGISFGDREMVRSLLIPHADAYALGLSSSGLLLLLMRYERKAQRALWVDLLAALCLTGAVWSKQTMALAPLGMLGVYAILFGLRPTARFAVIVSLFLAASFLLVVTTFDFSLIKLNGQTMPFNFPWKAGLFSDQLIYSPPLSVKLKVVASTIIELFEASLRFLLAPMLLLFFSLQQRLKIEIDRKKFAALAFWILCNAPLSVSGFLRGGGARNAFSFLLYPSAFLFVIVLMDLDLKAKAFKAGLTGLLLVLILPIESRRLAVDLFSLNSQRPLFEDKAYTYIKAHPGKSFFPDMPIAQAMAESKVYFGVLALMGREFGLMKCEQDCLRNLVPAAVKELYLKQDNVAGNETILKAFPEFKPAEPVLELAGFDAYHR